MILVISSQHDRLLLFGEMYYIVYPSFRGWISFEGTVTQWLHTE